MFVAQRPYCQVLLSTTSLHTLTKTLPVPILIDISASSDTFGEFCFYLVSENCLWLIRSTGLQWFRFYLLQDRRRWSIGRCQTKWTIDPPPPFFFGIAKINLNIVGPNAVENSRETIVSFLVSCESKNKNRASPLLYNHSKTITIQLL